MNYLTEIFLTKITSEEHLREYFTDQKNLLDEEVTEEMKNYFYWAFYKELPEPLINDILSEIDFFEIYKSI